MSLSIEAERPATVPLSTNSAPPASAASEPGYQLIRRNGAVTPFDPSKIAVALTKAFLAVEGSSAAASRRIHDVVAELTEQVVAGLKPATAMSNWIARRPWIGRACAGG